MVDEWLRVSLYTTYRITALVMQGSVHYIYWCKAFEIYFYKDGVRTLYEDKTGATVRESNIRIIN